MKATAFRVYDFKSIRNSGTCEFSGDGITVLAGQNESGKTALLTALRDFDGEEGDEPTTQDYRPDGQFEAESRVAIRFELSAEELEEVLKENKCLIPLSASAQIAREGGLWITRHLDSGTFALEDSLAKLWEDNPADGEDASARADGVTRPSPSQFGALLRAYWPLFIYFDSFEDILPRSVRFSLLKPPKVTLAQVATGVNPSATIPPPAPPQGAAQTPPSPKKRAPQPVLDFITLAGIDLDVIEKYAEDDKTLENYLSTRAASITGDFLTYWKTRVDGERAIDLRVRHYRNEAGELLLKFYVHDTSNQYPEQRSRGFLWFLSFYLRLAATRRRDPQRTRALLIDEPGTYLHARAQQDVLHLLEDRLAKADQIVYSTHSTYLIPTDRLHRLRIVVKDGNEGTLALDRLTHPRLRSDEFKDTLSPILSAIGLDIRGALTFVREKNLLVEGISDRFYLTSWGKALKKGTLDTFNIFPCFGASTIPTYASLFVGWGLRFVALLDRDGHGNAAREKLQKELLIHEKAIVQPKNASSIEDLFSHEDFKELAKALDPAFTIEASETPSKAIKRQRIDKVLLARKYAERVSAGNRTLTKRTSDNVESLFAQIEEAYTLASSPNIETSNG